MQELKKSLVVACDVPDGPSLIKLVRATEKNSLVTHYKIGITMLLMGLERAVGVINEAAGDRRDEIKIVYDHQKGGNDIPEMGGKFAKMLKKAGVDAAIIFPFAGPETQTEWTKACQGECLSVWTGGVMTHPKFLESEGGYISDEAPEKIFRLACTLGVTEFVVPGNKLAWVQKLRNILLQRLGEGNFYLNAPGFVTQKGVISDCGKVAGEKWRAIVGSGIYGLNSPEEMEAAVNTLTAQLVA